MTDKPKKLKWHVTAKYGDHNIEFSAETGDEVIAILLRWIRRVVPYEEWPLILKWRARIKE